MKSSWIKALADSITSNVDTVGPEWKTSREIAKEIGMSLRHTTGIIASLIEQKKASRKYFRAKTANGDIRLIPHYRLSK